MDTNFLPAKFSPKFDIPAGLIVAVVALPLALGFGITSGAGAASGITTAIIAGAIAGIFGGSNYQVSGPTGAMVVVLFPIISNIGVGALLLVGVLAGALIALAGFLRLGRFAEKIPWSVMEGFTLGIALVIALQQLPFLLGVQRGEGTEPLVIAANTIANFATTGGNYWAITICALTVGIKIIWNTVFRKRWPRLVAIPPSGVAVLVMTALTWWLAIPVETIGSIDVASLFRFDWSIPSVPIATLVYAVIVVAALGAIESLLSARVADAMVKRRDGEVRPFNPERELIGQGFATIASALFGGMPATGAIARTAVNINAGAKSKFSAILHSIFLLLLVSVLGGIVSHIPIAALAGVLLGASWRIANPGNLLENLRTTWPNRLAFLVSAAGVLAIDLIWGITLGIFVYLIADLFYRSRLRESNPRPSHYE